MKKLPSPVIAACLLLGGLNTIGTAAEKPNILLILSDDHGYADVGFQGCKDIPTPHLDRLAGEGLRCTNGYVTHAFCSPTRAGLMTGRYQQRFGHEQNPAYDPDSRSEGLPVTEKLLPEFLRGAGYVTGWVGKWHLGAAPEFQPQNRGFMEIFGFLGGGHHYQNWKVNPQPEYNIPLQRNGQPVDVTKHLTGAFGDEGAEFILRHKDKPWFLYLAFNAPHSPEEPTPERLEQFKSIADPMRRKYAAQVSLLDDAIGSVLTALRESGQDKRTLVFFFSDNGGPVMRGGWTGCSNEPLRDGKGTLYEGGVRVPVVVSWLGTIPSGKTYDAPVSSLDVFATSLALAGVPMPTDRVYDGMNLLPFLTGTNKSVPHNILFWRMGGGTYSGARESDSKLVRRANRADKLYHLSEDIGEQNDLSGTHAAEANELSAKVDAWNKTLVPPGFKGLAGRKEP